MSYEITDFQTDIIDASMNIPVVVDFWAPWCGPCGTLGPMLEKLVGEANNRWRLVKVNVDEHQELAVSFQVQSIPQVYLVFEGKIINGFSGALPEKELRDWLSEHLPEGGGEEEEPVSADLAAVHQWIAAGEEGKAAAALSQMLSEDADNVALKMLWAQVSLFTAPADVIALLKTIELDARESDRAEKLGMLADALAQDLSELTDHVARSYYEAAIAALKLRDFEEALDQFLDVLYRDKTYNEERARKTIIGIFEYLGRDHATTKGYQRRFEMAMF